MFAEKKWHGWDWDGGGEIDERGSAAAVIPSGGLGFDRFKEEEIDEGDKGVFVIL